MNQVTTEQEIQHFFLDNIALQNTTLAAEISSEFTVAYWGKKNTQHIEKESVVSIYYYFISELISMVLMIMLFLLIYSTRFLYLDRITF